MVDHGISWSTMVFRGRPWSIVVNFVWVSFHWGCADGRFHYVTALEWHGNPMGRLSTGNWKKVSSAIDYPNSPIISYSVRNLEWGFLRVNRLLTVTDVASADVNLCGLYRVLNCRNFKFTSVRLRIDNNRYCKHEAGTLKVGNRVNVFIRSDTHALKPPPPLCFSNVTILTYLYSSIW